jgi:hypothetical protein
MVIQRHSIEGRYRVTMQESHRPSSRDEGRREFRKQQVVGSTPTTGSSIRKGNDALPDFFCAGTIWAV